MTVKEDRSRILAWDGCYNVRELGGYETENGLRTRWGRVVRADNLIRLSEAGRQALVDYLNASGPLALDNPAAIDLKARGLVHLALAAPTYQLA